MTRIRGDADIAQVAALLADGTRARILLALSDGRALPASLLAAEAGVAPSTTSAHLQRLVDGGFVVVHPQGRYRYYRLSGPEVAGLIESLALLAPPVEIRSVKEGTRAQALRHARTCYDHLAGAVGVDVFRSLLATGAVVGGDGLHRYDGADRLSSQGRDLGYRLTVSGRRLLGDLGAVLPPADCDGSTPLRYCVDWTEQRHHLSGVVGRALTARLFELGWLERDDRRPRVVRVTATGERGLADFLGAPLAA